MAWYGSDVVVDLLVAHGIEYVAFNPGASFRGLHDSLVQRADGPRPVLCTHEGVAVAVAHGYAKATRRPMAVLLHDLVGLQHATMAIYNAWVDRVPVLLLGGTGPLSTPARRPWIDWIHTATDQSALVRDYTKWVDQPADLHSVPASLARGLRLASATPPGPVYICLDVAIQEEEVTGTAPAAVDDTGTIPTDPAPDPDAVAVIADRLRTAEAPVIVTDYAGATTRGYELLDDVARRTGAAVLDRGARHNISSTHPANAEGVDDVLAEADVVVGIDVEDLYGSLPGVYRQRVDGGITRRPGVVVVHVTPQHLKARGWAGDHQALAPVDLHVTASAHSGLAALADVLGAGPPAPHRVRDRLDGLTQRRSEARARWRRSADRETDGTGAIPAAYVAAALWSSVLRERPWTLVAGSLDGWERRLWDFTEPHQRLGWHGGGGLGYVPGATVGAALALSSDRFCVALQPDGDLLFTPGALWTLAHVGLPVLIVMHNNRQYRNTVEHAGEIARARGRDVGNRHVAAALDDPSIDYAALARSFGIRAVGPVQDSTELPGALREAARIVDGGRPALVDVVTSGA